MTWGMLPLWLKVWLFLGLGGFSICICPLRSLNPWNKWPRILWFAGLFGTSVGALIAYGNLVS